MRNGSSDSWPELGCVLYSVARSLPWGRVTPGVPLSLAPRGLSGKARLLLARSDLSEGTSPAQTGGGTLGEHAARLLARWDTDTG